MSKLEALIEEARRLPVPDRQRLLAEVERSLEGGPSAQLGGTYAPLLALAGSAPTDFADVSVDEYRHLARAIAPEPGGE